MLKNLFIAVLMLGFLTLVSPSAQAAREAGEIKTITQAADALKSAHPDLSQNLNQMAQQEQSEQKKKKKPMEGLSQQQMQSNVKTLRDSASALQSSNANLAKDLTKIADRDEKMMMKSTGTGASQTQQGATPSSRGGMGGGGY